MQFWLSRLLFVVLMGVAGAGHAHKPSDSHLTLDLTAEPARIRWDIALRDLEYALGIDADGDGALTWGEVRARHAAILEYARARLQVWAGESRCQLEDHGQLIARHTDGAYTVLTLELDCREQDRPLRLAYRLFFDLDPTHRGLVRIRTEDGERSLVLAPDQADVTLTAAVLSRWRQFSGYVGHGIEHILIGYDHILFLLVLLMPAGLRWERGQWRAAAGVRAPLKRMLAIVTAFTAAHSITLTAATLEWVSLPSRWVESAIAATVLAGALNNVYPLVHRFLWPIVFALGLIHGFGFASVLGEMNLAPGSLILSLFGFNLGVEIGQLALVAVFLPVVLVLRRTPLYGRGGLQLASSLVGVVALVWLLERSLDVVIVRV